MSAIPEPVAIATRYEVSCLPEDHDERSYMSVSVEYRGHGKWAASRMKRCYDIDGNPDWEPTPSSREDEWLARFRFDLDTALAVAKKVAPTLKLNRLSVADILAQDAQAVNPDA